METNCPECHGTGIDEIFESACTLCFPTPESARWQTRTSFADTGRTFGGGSSTGKGGPVTVERASDKQLAFIVRLGGEVPAEGLTKKMASVLIEKLLGQAEAPGTTPAVEVAPTRRPNKFAGKCHRCGGHVEAEAGWLGGERGAWTTEHREGLCVTVEAVEATVPAVEVTEGMWWLSDGRIARVQRGRESGHLYAKVLNDEADGFDFERGAMRLLDRRMTVEEAAAFGQRTGQCCVCGRTLENDLSVKLGIGPICRRRV
jgi:hypothetical protein